MPCGHSTVTFRENVVDAVLPDPGGHVRRQRLAQRGLRFKLFQDGMHQREAATDLKDVGMGRSEARFHRREVFHQQLSAGLRLIKVAKRSRQTKDGLTRAHVRLAQRAANSR